MDVFVLAIQIGTLTSKLIEPLSIKIHNQPSSVFVQLYNRELKTVHLILLKFKS
jgi:hypothetical protein